MNLRLLAAMSAAGVLSATATVPARAADSPPADDLVEVRSVTTPLGTHTWYRQTFHGVPVVDGYYAVHDLNGDGDDRAVDGRKEVPADLGISPGVKASAALAKASSHITEKAKGTPNGLLKDRTFVPAFGKGDTDLAVYEGKLVWDVVSTSETGATETFIDAATGAVNGSRVLSKNVAGGGAVFAPNPVQRLRDQTLVDGNDTDPGVPESAYVGKKLPRLDASHTLKGTYVAVVASNVPIASSATNEYYYWRSDDRFEQVNAYYGVDLAQARLTALGFSTVGAQRLRVNTITADNSFFSVVDKSLTFGTGGVDDAEDLDIVWHEFGHAIQDFYVPGFGTTEESGAIGEGFGDYLAVSLSKPMGGGYQDPCVADWDAVSYTSTVPHCLRRTDTSKTYPGSLVGEVHADGEIWSGALWNVLKAIGRNKADAVILAGNALSTPNITMPDAAACVVKSAGVLYDSTVEGKVSSKFAARGLGGGTCPG